ERRDQQRQHQDAVLGGERQPAVRERRIPVGLARADDDPGAEQGEQDEEQEPPRNPGCAQSNGHQPPFVTSERYFTKASIWAGWSVFPNVGGMTLAGKPFSTNALGLTIEVRMNAGVLPLSTLSRSGPTLPVAPASESVW